MIRLLFCASLLLFGACAMKPVHVDQLELAYATAPQPERVAVPLRVIIDPTLVPDHFRTTDPQTKKVDVHGVQAFVRRDLTNVLRDFFVDVAVADAGGPGAAGYIAEVRVVRIDTTADTKTSTTLGGDVETSHRAYGVIDWSLVVRDAATSAVVYSFADRAVGTFAMNAINETGPAFASTLETALIRLSQDLRTRNVVATLNAHAQAQATPAVTSP